MKTPPRLVLPFPHKPLKITKVWNDDEPSQRAAWRSRLVESVLTKQFDAATTAEMLMAGFDQSHTEGLADAADICRGVADSSDPPVRAAQILEQSIRKLIDMNNTSNQKARADFTRVCAEQDILDEDGKVK